MLRTALGVTPAVTALSVICGRLVYYFPSGNMRSRNETFRPAAGP